MSIDEISATTSHQQVIKIGNQTLDSFYKSQRQSNVIYKSTWEIRSGEEIKFKYWWCFYSEWLHRQYTSLHLLIS
jgi:hypothetical protein